MDTLCIPVKQEHSALRAQCIDAMASIYAGSNQGFVLDAELMATKLSAYPDKREALCQISCSVWMCRSWKLQEAILPVHCLFLFADRIFHPLWELQVDLTYFRRD